MDSKDIESGHGINVVDNQCSAVGHKSDESLWGREGVGQKVTNRDGGRMGVHQLNDVISERAKFSARSPKKFLGPIFLAKLAIFVQFLPKNAPNLVFVAHK